MWKIYNYSHRAVATRLGTLAGKVLTLNSKENLISSDLLYHQQLLHDSHALLAS